MNGYEQIVSRLKPVPVRENLKKILVKDCTQSIDSCG